MPSTHGSTSRFRRALCDETGSPTLISTIALVMFCLFYLAFILLPTLYQPRTREDVYGSVDAWTQLYARYGQDQIPEFSPAFSTGSWTPPNATLIDTAAGVNVNNQNSIRTRLASELLNNRYVDSIDQVVCGPVQNGRIVSTPSGGVPAEQRKAALVACGVQVRTSSTDWPWIPTDGPLGYLSRVYGDYWYMGTPLPLRRAAL